MKEDLIKLNQLDEHSFQLDFRGALGSAADAPDYSSVNGNNRFSLVVDCDEVLVNIIDKWLTKASREAVLRPYFTHEILAQMSGGNKFTTYSSIWRDEYYILNWLGVTDPEHRKLFNDLYFLDSEFYDDLLPTPFFRSLSSILDVVSSIDVLTMCGSDVDLPTNKSKAKWLHKYFTQLLTNRPDIEFKTHFIPESTPKGVYLKEKGIKFNLYVEDSVSNIVNVVETVEFDNFEVLVPLYGYNRHVAKAIKESSSELKLRITGFHNTDDYTQQEVLDAFQPEAA